MLCGETDKQKPGKPDQKYEDAGLGMRLSGGVLTWHIWDPMSVPSTKKEIVQISSNLISVNTGDVNYFPRKYKHSKGREYK